MLFVAQELLAEEHHAQLEQRGANGANLWFAQGPRETDTADMRGQRTNVERGFPNLYGDDGYVHGKYPVGAIVRCEGKQHRKSAPWPKPT